MNKNRLGRQSGAVIVLLGVMLPVLIGLLGITLYTAKRRAVQSQLRLASDAATHAGALEYARTELISVEESLEHVSVCQGDDCFENVITSAQRILDLNLERLESNASSSNALIERGSYSEASGFLSYEADQIVAPTGIQDSWLANAVRTQIDIALPFAGLQILPASLGEYGASTIATAGSVTPVLAAPLAIPYCSLLKDGNLSRDMGGFCTRDIYLTSSRRFCPPGESDCGILPSFSYEPFLPLDPSHFPGSLTGYRLSCFNGEVLPPAFNYEITAQNSCGWATPHFSTYAKNFGLFGLPRSALQGEISEAQVFDALINGIQMGLDDEFLILESGLTKAELQGQDTNQAIWRIITGNSLIGSEIGTITDFSESRWRRIEYNYNRAVDTNGINRRFICQGDYQNPRCRLGDPAPSSSLLGVRGGYLPGKHLVFWDYQQGRSGACNSMRDGFGHWDTWRDSTLQSACVPPAYVSRWPPMKGTDLHREFSNPGSNDEPFLTVQAAVIAPVDGSECGDDTTPLDGEAREFKTIGMIPLHLFDVDIAKDPPSYPSSCYGEAFSPPYPVNNGAEGTDYQWGFKPPWFDSDSDPKEFGRCNLIRARFPCDPQFFRDTNLESLARPILVD